VSGSTPHLATPAELQERLAAERSGEPFVLFRDGSGQQRIVTLPADAIVTFGRDRRCDVCVDWDAQMSRVHARLEPIAAEWTVNDDGLSRNGTYLNGERVAGRRRLRDGDQLEMGSTLVLFRAPRAGAATSTVAGGPAPAPELTPAQRRVLIALCRPFAAGGAIGTPATNRQIADELHLSVSAVKAHLRTLCNRFGVGPMPQNEKRTALVRVAFDRRAITPRDLQGPHEGQTTV
jgi:FHA domain/Winged helix-turn-helix DNA-binding